MKKAHVLLLAMVAAQLLIFPAMSHAAVLTLTLNTTNLTVIEGNTLNVSFTLNNGTASDIAIGNFAGGAASFTGPGDPSDSFINSVIAQDTCRFKTLAAGASCQFGINYITESSVGETDGDFGVNASGLCAEDANGHEIACTNNYQMMVQDPVSTPEPSSLFLLGGGLLGLVAYFVRKTQRHFQTVTLKT